MESTNQTTVNQEENEAQETTNSAENQQNQINSNHITQETNQDDQRDEYQNSNYQEQQENIKQENEQYEEAYNASYPNYNYSNNNPGSPNQSQSTYNRDTETKSNFNANALPGDKPWNRAAKDPTIVQKGTELFVGNLCMETVEEDLYESFQECGDIIDIRVHKNEQNKKCYAFLRFATKEMIKSALNKNMSMIRGRKIKVTKSNENSTIFIGNIRKNWTVTDVELKFPNSEKIEHFLDNSNQGRNRGFCFVVFKNRNEAIKALNYVNSKGGINIDGVPLTCDWADIVDEDDNNSRQIFVSGLKENVDEFKVREAFSTYGNITDLILSKNHKTAKRKDLAFITYETNEEAKSSVEKFDKEAHAEDIGDNITVSLAFSQQAMQTKKKIKENRKKPSGPPQMGMQPNPRYNQEFSQQMPQMHNQMNMSGESKKPNMNYHHQQPMYPPNNMMMPPQNNLNPMGAMNPMANIPGLNNMPNISGMPNMQNLSNPMNAMNPMQNKQMMPQQGYPQSNIPNLGNPMANMNQPPQNMQGMQHMNQYQQMAGMNPIPQVNPNQNMGNMYPGAVLPNQINPNMQPNPNIPQNLNQNQLMYLMGYNQAGYK